MKQLFKNLPEFLQQQSLIWIFIFVSLGLSAQESPLSEENQNHLQKANELYDKSLFLAAETLLEKIIEEQFFLESPQNLLLTEVKFKKALCGIRLDREKAHFPLLVFVKENPITPFTNLANIELASYYYNDQDYKRALQYFSKVDLEDLSNERYSEMMFKKAYCHFVRKDFGVVESILSQILHLNNEYTIPAKYYYAMSLYFNEDLEGAVAGFREIEREESYENRIPYYISQILFKEEKYEELLDYGNKVVQKPSTLNIKEIRGLLGQTYFLRKEYEKAIFHLAYYVENTKKLRAEDFYQLGFAYYQTKQYEKAVSQFVEIANEKSKLGQNANNYLANSYLQIDNSNGARTAFKRTAEMSFLPDLAEEAYFNYGKLSAEMAFDREALNTLKNIEPSSVYFAEAQQILSHILQNTKDYGEALRFIEELEMQSPLMQTSYQRIAYYYAMQYLVDGEKLDALDNFNKSLKFPREDEITAQTYFRLADLDHESKRYQQSITKLNKYFSLVKTGISLPKDADEAYANYLQAYNYLKLENYTSARTYFESAANDFKNDASRKKLAMDATLRAGDSYFRINAYEDAIKFYNQAINLRGQGTDYALYQRGVLQGLLGRPFEKLVSLDELIDKYPSSPLADFALFQNGETLQAIGEASEAERSFKSILDNYKNSTLRNRVLLKLGLISFNQGNLNEAIRYYKQLFSYNPNAKESLEAIIALEEIYVDNLAQPDEYFDFVEKQAGFEISTFEKDSISFRSGEVSYENGDYEKAINAYSNYLARYPKGFNRLLAHYRRAESYLTQKSYEKALADYEFVIKQSFSEFYMPSLEKAALISYNLLEDFKKAFDYYSLYEELSPDKDKQYQAQLGALRSAARINELDGIQYMADRILNNPLVTEEDRTLAYYHLAKSSLAKADTVQASVQLGLVIDGSGNSYTAEARYLKGQLLFVQGKYELSEKVARQSIVDSKAYPYWVAKSLMLLSDLFVQQNDFLQAKAALEAIIENYTQDEDITAEAESRLEQVLLQEEESNRVEVDSLQSDLKLEKTNKQN